MTIVLFILIVLCLCAIIGDGLLVGIHSATLRACVDCVTHGIIGLLSWTAFAIKMPERYCLISKNFDMFLSAALASLIDLDHFILANSLSIKDAVHLGSKRPILHCTSLWIVLIAACFVVAKILKIDWLTTLAWLFSMSSFSHHIRDGTRRGIWLWPFGSTPPIPYFLYILLISILPLSKKILVKYSDKSKSNIYII